MLRTLLLLTLLFPLSFLAPTVASADTNVLFIVDASGSMKEKIDGKTRMDVAKKVMSDTLAIIDHEFSGEDGAAPDDENQNWRPNKAWHYQLPKDKKLSDISSTGKLRIRVEIK